MSTRIAQLEPSHPASEPFATETISIPYRASRLESETYLQSRPAPCKIRNLRNYASRIKNLPSTRTQLPSESISSSIALWNQYLDPESRYLQLNQINNLRNLIRNHAFTCFGKQKSRLALPSPARDLPFATASVPFHQLFQVRHILFERLSPCLRQPHPRPRLLPHKVFLHLQVALLLQRADMRAQVP